MMSRVSMVSFSSLVQRSLSHSSVAAIFNFGVNAFLTTAVHHKTEALYVEGEVFLLKRIRFFCREDKNKARGTLLLMKSSSVMMASTSSSRELK